MSDLVSTAPRPMPSVQAFDLSPPRRLPVGPFHAAAGVVMASLLLVVANPSFGAVARTWPWDLPSPGRWTSERSAAFVLGAASLALLAAALLPQGKARAGLAILACAVPIAALRTGSRADLFPLTAWVPAALAGLLGGGLYGALGSDRGGAGRRVVATCSFVLAALLLYPLDLPPEPAGAQAEYSSWLLEVLASVGLTTGEGPPGLRMDLLQPAVVLPLLSAVLVVVGLLAVGLRSRPLAWIGVAATGVALLWPLAAPYVAAPDPETLHGAGLEGLPASEASLRLSSGALLAYVLPSALGLFAVAADLVRLRPRGVLPAPTPLVRGGEIREER